jgi:hypothetical protein
MKSNTLYKFIREAVVTVPKVIQYLSPAYKSYDYFLARIEGLVRGVYGNNIGGDFVDILASLIRGQMDDAYRKAWTDEGNDGALPDYITNSLDAYVIQQTNFDWIYQYYKDIVDARIDGKPIDGLLARSKTWANRWTEAYNEAIHAMTLENGGNEIWLMGDAEHCTTCLALNGIVATAKEWEISGWKPQGQDLACNGYNCKCKRIPTNKRRSPKALDTLMNIRLTQ